MGPLTGKDKLLVQIPKDIFSDKELRDVDRGKLHMALNQAYEAGKQRGYSEGTEDTVAAALT